MASAQLEVGERRPEPVGQRAQAPLRLRRSRSSLAGDGERKMQQRQHLSLSLYRHADRVRCRRIRVAAADRLQAARDMRTPEAQRPAFVRNEQCVGGGLPPHAATCFQRSRDSR
jgi:hypothetical protein